MMELLTVTQLLTKNHIPMLGIESEPKSESNISNKELHEQVKSCQLVSTAYYKAKASGFESGLELDKKGVGGTMNKSQCECVDYSKDSLKDVIRDVRRGCLCHSELETAVVTLYENGTIRECNQAAADLLGCTPSKLTWQHISTILPQLTEDTLMQGEKINPHLRFLSHIGYDFEVIGLSGVHFACALFFNEVESLGHHYLRLIIRPTTQGLTAS